MMPDKDQHDTPISVVEDLDPEPERLKGRAWWRSSRIGEVALGLLLLFSVLGWAGFTSWQNADNESNYEQAQQDASLRHWDDALVHFSSARGYKDADARAAEASRQIDTRNSQYAAAKSYQKAGKSIQMLLAARAVQAIQPGYKDADKLALQAEDQVYTDALSGTVAMRTGVYPQGLYYRGPTGWVYLQSSDQWSSVLSVPFSAAGANRIVYDVPGPDWRDHALLTRLPFNQYDFEVTVGLPAKAGRRLIMAVFPGGAEGPTFQNLQLNAADYNFYICGAAGVWGIQYNPRVLDTVIAKGILDGFAPAYEELTRTPGSAKSNANGPATPNAAPVALPGADSVVADFGHNSSGGSDKLLLAAHGTGPSDKGMTELFLARADGSGPRIVFSTTGALVSALLSPDDRHALVVTSDYISTVGTTGRQAVVAILLTLDGTAPPKTLQKITLDDSVPVPAGQLTISGVFLENGLLKNKLLLGWFDSASPTRVKLRLLDVYDPEKVLAETSIPYAQTGVLPVVEQADGRTLLLYDQGVPTDSGENSAPATRLTVLQLESGTDAVKLTSYSIPLPRSDIPGGSTPYFMNPTLRGDNLIYTVETFTTVPETSSIYHFTLPGTNEPATQPAQIFNDAWSRSQASGRAWPVPSVAGPGAYGYVDGGGTLHAHPYDAETDVSLETGVGNIFVPGANYFYKLLH